MTNHVVNLELAKQLKEAGYPQEAIYSHWSGAFDTVDLTEMKFYLPKKTPPMRIIAAAPLATELLDQLPYLIEKDGLQHYLHLCKAGDDINVAFYSADNDDPHKVLGMRSHGGDTAPNALAAMWLWLKKEGLV